MCKIIINIFINDQLLDFNQDFLNLLEPEARESLQNVDRFQLHSFVHVPGHQEDNVVETEINDQEVTGEKELVVAAIKDRRFSRTYRRYEWLVSWENYPPSEDTWEQEECFWSGSTVNDIFKIYEECHPRQAQENWMVKINGRRNL